MTDLLASVGRGGIAVGSFLWECVQLVRSFLYWTTIAPFKGYPIRFHEAARQSVRVGVQSIPIVFLVNFFVGATLAFTVAEILDLFGATEYTAAIMGVGFWRELGPLLTGIIMAGYVGASLAAEIGNDNLGREPLLTRDPDIGRQFLLFTGQRLDRRLFAPFRAIRQ